MQSGVDRKGLSRVEVPTIIPSHIAAAGRVTPFPTGQYRSIQEVCNPTRPPPSLFLRNRSERNPPVPFAHRRSIVRAGDSSVLCIVDVQEVAVTGPRCV